MNIEEERELFLNWHYNQYLSENLDIDKGNAKYIYDYAHKNILVSQLRDSHFTAWLASGSRNGGAAVVVDNSIVQLTDINKKYLESNGFRFKDMKELP